MKIVSFLVALFFLILGGCSGINPKSADDKPSVSPFTSAHTSPAAKPPVKERVQRHKGQLTLSWDAVDGASWYNLYYGDKPGVTKRSKNKVTKIHTTSHTVTGLSPGSVYFFVVTAANTRTESAESCEVSGRATRD